MRSCLYIAVFALVAGCSVPQSSQTQRVPSSSGKAVSQEVSLNLDPAGKEVKAQLFSSGEELLREVEKLGGARGEYETDSAFYGRMSKLGDFSIASKVSTSQIKFNAASGEFTLDASMHNAQGFGFKSNLDAVTALKTVYPAFIAGEDIYNGSQYSGQNSYGASALITKRTINRYYLVFSPVPKPPLNTLFFHVRSRLNITGAEMESERENIRIVFTVKATPNYLQVTKDYQQPKISNPFESVINNYFFSAKVYWVKVVNIKTGRVYSDEAKLGIEVI
ncbi:hypothetical protein [Pseudomonas siliginis]|uniref:Uncharacterized protein n=1 Tax=Pseudomonas siliginis TaxID=2842346 RepID=A0ABY5CIW4_9PSED|nr:hypothetical protein [Pseudomonas siliginis]UST85797.1 hypothetical protein NF677_03715 [Pseudomonas siliginis]